MASVSFIADGVFMLYSKFIKFLNKFDLINNLAIKRRIRTCRAFINYSFRSKTLRGFITLRESSLRELLHCLFSHLLWSP